MDGFAEAGFDFFVDFGFDFGLEFADELVVGLVGDDGEDVDTFVLDALAGVVDGETDATADFLAFAHVGDGLVEGADLEDVGVVPAFAEGGVGEDEGGGFVEGEEAFFGLHDQFVGFAVLSGFAGGGVEEFSGASFAGFLGKVGGLDGGGVLVAPVGVAGFEVVEVAVEECTQQAVVGSVVVDAVDEEEGEDFDACWLEDGLFAEVFFDGVADLGFEDSVFVAADFLADGEWVGVAKEGDVAHAVVDFVDDVVVVDGSAA